MTDPVTGGRAADARGGSVQPPRPGMACGEIECLNANDCPTICLALPDHLDNDGDRFGHRQPAEGIRLTEVDNI